MNEHATTHGVSFQGLSFRYTEHGTLLVILEGSHHRELNPREAADLLAYLNAFQGDLLKNADAGDMVSWPLIELGALGKSQLSTDILDSYEKKNAYSEGDDGKHHNGV